MKLNEPLKPNTAMLACTLAIVAALIWNVQVNRYHLTEKGYIFDAVSLSFSGAVAPMPCRAYDPYSKQWLQIIEDK